MEKDCPVIHSQKQGRSTSPRRKEKGQEKFIEKEKGTDCHCENCKTLTWGDVMDVHASWNFQTYHLIAGVKPRASETIQNAHKRHSCAQTETPVRKDKHQIVTSKFGKDNIQRQLSISGRNPNRCAQRKMPKCTTVWPKVCRVYWGARSIQTSQWALQKSKDITNMSTTQTFPEVISPQRRRLPLTTWRYIPKKGCTY